MAVKAHDIARREAPSPRLVSRWFHDEMKKDDPKPSMESCEYLARQFQLIALTMNNDAIEKAARMNGERPDLLESGLTEISFADWQTMQLRGFTDAVQRTIIEIRSLGTEFDNHQFLCPARGLDGSISLAEIHDLLRFIPIGAPALNLPPGRKGPQPGCEPWHKGGRAVARLVQSSLKEIGFKGSSSMTQPESVTALVGSSAIRWALRTSTPTASGFAAAMKPRRDRSADAPRSFEDRFPQAGRLKQD